MSAPPTTYYRDVPTKELLEREYSPSSMVDDIGVYLQQYAARSAQTRTQIPAATLGLRYGSAAEESLDFFPQRAAMKNARTPLCVYIHGGYWQELSKDESSFPAEQFGQQGIAFAALNYGLAPRTSLPAMVARCRRAIAFLYDAAERLGFDRHSIVVSGSSAGAHLAAMTMLTDWRGEFGLTDTVLRGAILLSGVFDLRPIRLTYVNEPLQLDVASALLNSPLLLVDFVGGPIPPTLIGYGEHETREFKRQSEEFGAALARRGAEVTRLSLAGRNHFDALFDLADARTELGRAVLGHFAISLAQAPQSGEG